MPASSPQHPRQQFRPVSDSFFWVTVIAYFWAIIGLGLGAYGVLGLPSINQQASPEVGRQILSYLAIGLCVLYFSGMVGILLQCRWAYYLSLVLSIFLLLMIPIGLLLAPFCIKALVKSKVDFNL